MSKRNRNDEGFIVGLINFAFGIESGNLQRKKGEPSGLRAKTFRQDRYRQYPGGVHDHTWSRTTEGGRHQEGYHGENYPTKNNKPPKR